MTWIKTPPMKRGHYWYKTKSGIMSAVYADTYHDGMRSQQYPYPMDGEWWYEPIIPPWEVDPKRKCHFCRGKGTLEIHEALVLDQLSEMMMVDMPNELPLPQSQRGA